MEQEINVLVIEDKQENAVFLEQVIKSLGYKVWVVPDGREAVKLVKNNIFPCIVTELHMQGMSGIEITKSMLKMVPHVSIIVVTAYSFISSAIEAMEEGAYGYITKPFNSSEIRIVLERAIERFFLLSSDSEKEQYAELSVKDGLTGAYNHRYFDICIANKINMVKRHSDNFSLLMIDVDNFKKYNDTEGHLAGDDLLRKMSKLFHEAVRQKDSVFRYGGEEFVIYLDNTDKKGAGLVAERIRTLVNLYMPTSVSMGVSTYPADGSTQAELVSKADEALYKAKTGGKNKVCLA